MKAVGAGARDHIDYTARHGTEFRIEIARQQAKLHQSVRIRSEVASLSKTAGVRHAIQVIGVVVDPHSIHAEGRANDVTGDLTDRALRLAIVCNARRDLHEIVCISAIQWKVFQSLLIYG